VLRSDADRGCIYVLYISFLFGVQRTNKGAHYLTKRTKTVSENRESRGFGLHWSVSVIEIGVGIDELILSGSQSVTLKAVPIKRGMEQI
jgi:hypothetical protein